MKSKIFFALAIAVALTLTVGSVAAQKSGSTFDIRSTYIDDNESILNFSRDGHDYKVKMTGKTVDEIFRDGNKIAKEDFHKYDGMIKDLLAELEKQREEAEKMRKEADVQRKAAEKQREAAEKQREEAAEARKQADKFRAEAEVQRGQAEKQRLEADKMRFEAEKQRKEADEMRAQADIQRKEAEKQRELAEVQRKEADKQREIAEKERKKLEEMLDEIVDEKIVASRSALKDVYLDANELVVNGQKQNDSLHKRFKEKYLKGKRMHYQHNDSFTRFSVD